MKIFGIFIWTMLESLENVLASVNLRILFSLFYEF